MEHSSQSKTLATASHRHAEAPNFGIIARRNDMTTTLLSEHEEQRSHATVRGQSALLSAVKGPMAASQRHIEAEGQCN